MLQVNIHQMKQRLSASVCTSLFISDIHFQKKRDRQINTDIQFKLQNTGIYTCFLKKQVLEKDRDWSGEHEEM